MCQALLITSFKITLTFSGNLFEEGVEEPALDEVSASFVVSIASSIAEASSPFFEFAAKAMSAEAASSCVEPFMFFNSDMISPSVGYVEDREVRKKSENFIACSIKGEGFQVQEHKEHRCILERTTAFLLCMIQVRWRERNLRERGAFQKGCFYLKYPMS